MFSKLMTTGSQFVMEGVRNLVIGERVGNLTVVCIVSVLIGIVLLLQHLPVTRIVDTLTEMKSSTVRCY